MKKKYQKRLKASSTHSCSKEQSEDHSQNQRNYKIDDK